MSITLSHEMFSKLSQASRDEILQAFTSTVISRIKSDQTEPMVESQPQTGAFESASLTFGKPLVLPSVRVAENYPVAKPTNLYSLAPLADLHRICKEIDEGRFISNSKSIKWTKGSRFHHMDWDVKRVAMEVKYLQPATSVQINNALPTMDRYRVSAILRELRKQGILIVT